MSITEGKWEVEVQDSQVTWVLCNGQVIARMGFNLSPEDKEKYAQLLASAPALYRELKELVSIVDGIHEGVDYTIDSFTTQPSKAAIASAEGKESQQ